MELTNTFTKVETVTNGDSHDHSGGDGAQIDHSGLANLSNDDHPQYQKVLTFDSAYKCYLITS